MTAKEPETQIESSNQGMDSTPAAESLDLVPLTLKDDNGSKDPCVRTQSEAEERAEVISLGGNDGEGDDAMNLAPVRKKQIVSSLRQGSCSSISSHSKQNGKSGLSELSKQLRVLQAKNESQQVEISRLERQIRILSELHGVHVGDLRRALVQACSDEAFGELQHRVAQLEAQLEAATLQRQHPSGDKSASSRAHDEATSKKVANLELRVGEMEEVEDTLRSEVQGLYSQLMEQQTRASRFESMFKEQEAENQRLKINLIEHSTQTQQQMFEKNSPEQEQRYQKQLGFYLFFLLRLN